MPTLEISHYVDVIMSAMVSQITGVSIVCLIVNSGADQRKHQSSALLGFVRRIHRWPVNSPHKSPVTWKCFHLMTSSWMYLHYFAIPAPPNDTNAVFPTCGFDDPEDPGCGVFSSVIVDPHQDLHWLWSSGPTHSHGTGPSHDATFGGSKTLKDPFTYW